LAVGPLEVAILNALGSWTTVGAVVRGLSSFDSGSVQSAVETLLEQGILEASDRPSHPGERAYRRWGAWAPEAAFFHAATRDVQFSDQATRIAFESREISDRLRVAPLKEYEGRARLRLPDFHRDSELARTLLARRSWRRFGETPITLDAVANLLGLTWGVQRWVVGKGERFPLKTSPSGGARHSLEVYLCANEVLGLSSGLYHYSPDAHSLVLLREGDMRATLKGALPQQQAFATAPAVFFMTSVFARVQWRYKFARAYRVVLLEAGHFCQSFCLVATSMGLAPFNTAALGDSFIEEKLGIDGVSEAVLYAAGVGSRPAETAWAPWPDRSSVPETVEPAHATPPDAASESCGG
jgi:SagB-type dehydrogenase family enzyme